MSLGGQLPQVIGVEPGNLAPGTPVDRLSPNVLPKAIAQGERAKPLVLAAALTASMSPSSQSRSTKALCIRV